MKILVTGGTGSVGRSVVARLIRHGHEVKVIGRRTGIVIEGGDYQPCDITDYPSLREQIRGMDAVVHLAAIPSPLGGAGHEIFRINCTGSFNVYHAAADEGIKRIVSASSINAFGYHYGVRSFDLLYFPVDEEHPGFTTDPYSFSKQILEDIAEYFWRRVGISGVCLRLPAVYELSEERKSRMVEYMPRTRETYSAIIALPNEQRKERVRHLFSIIDAIRAERLTGDHGGRGELDRRERFMVSGITNFWTNINAEDSAQAVEKGLLAEYEGSHPLFINDSHNSVGIESEMLASIFFPGARDRRHPLRGTEALVSIDKARKLIGFEPEHSVSQWYQ